MVDYFFNDKNYPNKVKSTSNLRLVSFFIWQYVIGSFMYYILTRISQNYYISYYLMNNNKLIFQIGEYSKLYFLFGIVTYYKFILFQNYEEYLTKFHLLIKIILEPRFQTLFLFLNSALISIIMNIIISKSLTGKERNSDLLVVGYGICNSLIFLFTKKNFKWSKIHFNRITSMKHSIKKFLKVFPIFMMVNLLIYFVAMCIEEKRLVLKLLTYKFYIFMIASQLIEFMNFISYNILKIWLCTPINPKNSENRISEEVIMIKTDFNSSHRFLNLHYLQNLIKIYEKNINISHLPSNNIAFLTSKEAIMELKSKIEPIFEEFNRKFNKLSNQDNKENEQFIKFFNLNLDFSELFVKSTSFQMLYFAAKILNLVIILFTKHNLLFQHDPNYIYNESNLINNRIPIKNLSSQQYIIHFLEILICFEDNLNKLINCEKFSSLFISNKSLTNEIKNLKESTTNRIAEIFIKNFRQNFIMLDGEIVKNKLQEYI